MWLSTSRQRARTFTHTAALKKTREELNGLTPLKYSDAPISSVYMSINMSKLKNYIVPTDINEAPGPP